MSMFAANARAMAAAMIVKIEKNFMIRNESGAEDCIPKFQVVRMKKVSYLYFGHFRGMQLPVISQSTCCRRMSPGPVWCDLRRPVLALPSACP